MTPSSPNEDLQSLKTKVATACRLFDASGLSDYSGHISVRVPDSDRFLINGRSATRSTLSPDDVIECDADGQSLTAHDRAPMEVPIHTQIYRRRPDVNSIAHFHPHHAVVLSVLGRPIEPVFLKGPMVGRVLIHPDPRHIATVAQGDRVADTLGDGRAVLLRGHGAVVVGPSVEGVFYLAISLEEHAHRYQDALMLGEPQAMSEDEVRDLVATGMKPEWFMRVWNYYLSKLP